jgi:hypothetical protein
MVNTLDSETAYAASSFRDFLQCLLIIPEAATQSMSPIKISIFWNIAQYIPWNLTDVSEKHVACLKFSRFSSVAPNYS